MLDSIEKALDVRFNNISVLAKLQPGAQRLYSVPGPNPGAITIAARQKILLVYGL